MADEGAEYAPHQQMRVEATPRGASPMLARGCVAFGPPCRRARVAGAQRLLCRRLLLGELSVRRELARLFLLLKHHRAEALQAGRFSHRWWPWDGLGAPLASTVHHRTLLDALLQFQSAFAFRFFFFLPLPPPRIPSGLRRQTRVCAVLPVESRSASHLGRRVWGSFRLFFMDSRKGLSGILDAASVGRNGLRIEATVAAVAVMLCAGCETRQTGPGPASRATATDVRAITELLEATASHDAEMSARLGATHLGTWRTVAGDVAGALGISGEALTSVLPLSGADPMLLRSGGRELSLTPLDANPRSVVRADGRFAVVGEQFEQTDTVVVAGSDFLETFWILRGHGAPRRLEWNLNGPGWLAGIRGDGRGGAELVDARGEVSLAIARPFALDGNGRRVPCHLEIEGLRLAVVVPDAVLQFPVLVDPFIHAPGWFEVSPLPSTRRGHALTKFGDKLLLFGGRDDGPSGQMLGDTWEWDGRNWTRRYPAHSPPPRAYHAMAELGGRVVLFGGSAEGGLLSDTWEWDGEDWVERRPAESPTRRTNHAMAAISGKVLLFGGQAFNGVTEVLNAETWVWDGVNWTRLMPGTSPPPRQGHSMATLGVEVILFGGAGGSGYLDDTWVWSGQNWVQRTPSTRPPPRSSHAIAPLGTSVVLFGGYSGAGNLNDTWIWDGVDWSSYVGVSPSARSSHAMAPIGGNVVLFAGSFSRDVWSWDGVAWSKKADLLPLERNGGAMAPLGGKLVLFGGACCYSYLADTWEWDGTHWTKREPQHSPAIRTGHAMAPLGQEVVLFGGLYVSDHYSDTWTWDGNDWTLRTPLTRPKRRHSHAMTTLNGRVVLFGGYDPLDDTWEWDGTNWIERTPPTKPPGRWGHAMVTYDQRALIFGGKNQAGYLDDTWEWDGSTWTKRSPATSPPARAGHAMVAIGRRVVLFGGNNASQAFSDLWVWDGSNWTPGPLAGTTGPIARSVIQSGALGRTAYIFGGWGNNSFLNDIWRYVYPQPNGEPCTVGAECASGFCVDGVCCDSACGASDMTDCQACSVDAGAPADGVCGLLTAGAVCRPGGCTENNEAFSEAHCSGSSAECPLTQRVECDGGRCLAGLCVFAQDAGASGGDGGSGSPLPGDGSIPHVGNESTGRQERRLAVGCGCGGAGNPGALLMLPALLARRRRPADGQSPRGDSGGVRVHGD